MCNFISRLLRNLNRLAIQHLGLALLGNRRANRLQLVRADDGGRNNRATGLERKSCGTGVSLVPSGLRVPSMWIPNRCPSSIISRACLSAPSDLLPPERSTGNTPTDVNHHFLNLPFNPLPSKYSALPMKCTMRGQVIGIKASSITARWLAAIIAPPSRGTLFSPLTAGLKR